METKLKEKEASLYYLIQDAGYDAREMARRILSKYKMTDDELSDFVIESRNKIVKDWTKPDLKERTTDGLLSLLLTASDKIKDISTISNNLLNGDNPLDVLILLDILNQRLDKKELDIEKINSIFKSILLKPSSKNIIKEQILNENYRVYDWSVVSQFTKLVRLLDTTHDENLAYLIKEILYSPKINELDHNLIKQSVPLIATILGMNYINVLEDLVVKFINSEKILYSLKTELKSSNDKKVYDKLEIAKIYSELYTSQSKVLVDNHLEVLSRYSDESLKLFIDTLDSGIINKKDSYNRSNLVSALISLNKSELAMQVFEKSCYKPIDKAKRAKDLIHSHLDSLYGSDFSNRLNCVINSCLNKSDYETLFRVLAHRKVDSLDAHYIYDILVNTVREKIDGDGIVQCCPVELRDKILEVIKRKIDNEKLLVYKTMNHWSEKRESLCYEKDKALRYVDFVNMHLDMNSREIEEEFIKENRMKTKYHSNR